MSESKLERPTFLRAYIDSLGKSIDRRGKLALVPWWLLTSLGIGAVVTYFMPIHFWNTGNQAISVPVYTAALTINGLILALSWSAFSRIHESMCGDDFCLYLMKNELLGGYIVYITYVHASQVIAVIASTAGLIVLLYETAPLYNQIAFGAIIAFSFYAIKQAMNSVTIMHDLIWQKAIFQRHMQAEREHGERVVEFRRGD